MPEDPESDMTPETSLQFEYGSNGAGQSDSVTNGLDVIFMFEIKIFAFARWPYSHDLKFFCFIH